MRAYTVAAASVALKVPLKWVDNVLSHHRLSGVTQARQGVTRRVNTEAIIVLEIALRITRSMAVPLHKSLDIADRLARAGNSSIELPEGILISLDITAIEADVIRRLAHAVEIAPSPRRGRPRGNRK